MQILDLEAIADLREMLGDEVDELFAEFLQQVPEELGMMRTSLQQGDRETVRQKAHQMKGSASNLGVATFAELCRQLEEGLRQDQLPDVAAELEKIQACFLQAEREIHRLMNR